MFCRERRCGQLSNGVGSSREPKARSGLLRPAALVLNRNGDARERLVVDAPPGTCGCQADHATLSRVDVTGLQKVRSKRPGVEEVRLAPILGDRDDRLVTPSR